MGLFRKATSAANQLDPVTDLAMALSPSIRRVEKLEARGTPANGVITGIKFTLNDDTTRQDYAVTVLGTGARFGIRAYPHHLHRLRLGLPVVVKAEGQRAIFDWDAMTAAWGFHDEYAGQDALRKAPDDGIQDSALDFRVQRHLRKWSPVMATVLSLTRVTMLGLPTVNFDIELELADGSRALSKRDDVPPYAQWWAVPGAVVPAVVDPEKTSVANIDWAAYARSKRDEVGFDDDPIEGSIAAILEQPVEATPTMATEPAAVDPSAPATLDMSMQSWVGARRGGQMSERDFEKALADWKEAGMCNDAQIEAARAAAGSAG